MAKRNTVPSFLPCVATHYRNVAKTMVRKVTDIESTILEHNGHLAPEVLEALGELRHAAVKVRNALDARCSDPQYTDPKASTASDASAQ